MTCRNCRRPFTEDNPDVGFGHCRECVGVAANEPIPNPESYDDDGTCYMLKDQGDR